MIFLEFGFCAVNNVYMLAITMIYQYVHVAARASLFLCTRPRGGSLKSSAPFTIKT